jgi:sugar lactone lactonase YvrE
MRLVTPLASAVLLACAPDNELPGPGDCDVDVADVAAPSAEAIALAAEPASFDDLWFSEALDRVLAIPQGTGTLYEIEPETATVVAIEGLPSGIASADATETRIYVADRGGRRVLVLAADSGDIVQIAELEGRPDYLRVAPMQDELWVTEPSADAIEVLAIGEGGELSPAGFVDVPGGPEGLAFDASGTWAYAERFAGPLVAIDVARREVVDTWTTGCAGAHGFPQADGERGLAFAGCSSAGGAAVVRTDDGRVVAGFEAGGGEAILAYDEALAHFYLRGDPDGELAILGVCASGELAELAVVEISQDGHGMTSDHHGNVWIADATTGGVLRVVDPYPPF